MPLRCALRRRDQNLILNLRIVIRTWLFKATAEEKGASISQPPEDEWEDARVTLRVRRRGRDELNTPKLISTCLFKCSSNGNPLITQSSTQRVQQWVSEISVKVGAERREKTHIPTPQRALHGLGGWGEIFVIWCFWSPSSHLQTDFTALDTYCSSPTDVIFAEEWLHNRQFSFCPSWSLKFETADVLFLP